MNRFHNLIYECCLCLIALMALPKMLYGVFIYKKYRHSLLARLGFNFPFFPPKQGPRIWIHAVSVGETKAVVSLARELKHRFNQCELIVSSITETGHAEAKRSLPFADYHVYLPLDFSLIMSRIVGHVAPDLVLLCESDLWYNFLRYAKRQGAYIALVNGKMSERSMHRLSKIPFFSKRLLSVFDVLCEQNPLYKERFLQAGAPSEKLVVTGNLKLDEDYPQLSKEEVKEWRLKLGIKPDQPVLTIGSTHDPEEKLLIEQLKKIWIKFPEVKVLLVPRHPERFKEVAHLLEKERINFLSYTDINRKTGHEQVFLIDAMGMLRMCYQLSDIAIVAGSFTSKVGGHNILEPCWYGKPILFGPYMHKQFELVQLIKQYKAGEQVEIEEIQEVLENWLANSEDRQKMGQKGLQLMTELKGSTKRTLSALCPFLENLERPLKGLVKRN